MKSEEEDYLDLVNPERREFLKKMITIAFAIPVVVSVSMLDQKFDLSSASAVVGPNGPNGPNSYPGINPAINLLLLNDN
ncbi:MAG TPA: hypothetical protein PK874_05000 [Desulfobacteraceae bacterium]|nr:hypothetical protein [Desulfobacteraceae bacterium]HPJ68078.1 hypothetical protein [Desulfobacteraceae bacterium]HPQ28633.1 hypothetical protein [Desulfobacteraceae bacterium]